jgi:KaiC/GvpD/RAD55 family RecA-like ATPase
MYMNLDPNEEEYCWFDAAKSYETALESGITDKSSLADLWMRIGYCYELGSRQATKIDDFQSIRKLSVRAYQKAAEIFGEFPFQGSVSRRLHCLTLAQYVMTWLEVESSPKLKALDNCRSLAKQAMESYKNDRNDLGYGQVANILSKCLFERLYSTFERVEKSQIAQEGIDTALEAISTLSRTDSKEDLLTAYSQASIQEWYISISDEHEEVRNSAASKSLSFSANAIELSKDIRNPYAKALSRWGGVWSNLFFADDIDVSLKYAQEMLEQASIVRDNYFMGLAYYMLCDVTNMKSDGEANPDKRKLQLEDVLKFSEKAVKLLDLVYQDCFIAETYLLPAETYSCLASDYATNLTEKLLYSRKAIDIGKKGLEYATRSCSPEAMFTATHALSKAYYCYASLEPKRDYKPELLAEALKYRKEYLRITKAAFPSNTWNLGVAMFYMAKIETALSKLDREENRRIVLLKDAISDMEQGVSYAKNWVDSRSLLSFVVSVATYEDTLGRTLDDCYLLTCEHELLTKANGVYINAAEDFKKMDMPSRVAESYWKIGRNHDRASSPDQAAKNFENAFAAYKSAAQKISEFSDFYLDYASYMKAWSEIEFAKYAHSEEKYEHATQHYEKASQLLRQSKTWMYLSENFYSWSLLERAEDFSRKDKTDEAIEAFEKAIKFLQDSKRILSIKLESIDREDERDFIKGLIHVSDVREEFSQGRIAIEEAKALDKKGEFSKSSDKYGNAFAVFQKISLLDSEQAGKEAKPLAYLCQAWQKMTMAEQRASPIMYEEAAELFDLANKNASKDSTSLVAQGHSSFAKAMEAGTEFEITQTMAMYEESTRHMEAAASFYSKAGLETNSHYMKATQRMFDAYVFMESAKREREPEKKTKNYANAEKMLQNAAEYFEKARYQNKNEQVQKLLKKVREEKKLALSLSEILNAPEIISSTSSFSTLNPVQENAVGLERFEEGDIQVKLIQQETEVKVGGTATIEIQMMNVGKEPVSLIEIEGLVPKGFQLSEKPDYCQLENSQLKMKGKRLDPLKPEKIKFSLKSFKIGTTEVKPLIICLDQVGRQVSYKPEPILFNVLATALPGRVPTGYVDLDNLLFGGIPENYSVILESPSSDETEHLIRKFIETGVRNGQTTYLVSAEVGEFANLAEEYPRLFSLFLCNPRADVLIKSQPNVFKIKGIEGLTDLDIAMLKSFRTLTSESGPRRLCIKIVSDVLLQHHAIVTRKWLGGLLADFKSKGFTTLAVINQEMHPTEEVQAIISLFDGEIRVTERETERGLEKFLRIRKMCSQRYLDNEITLTREKLEN